MDRFDFSGMDIFWEIFDLLQADREPDNGHWDRLFDTPGYAVLVEYPPVSFVIFQNDARGFAQAVEKAPEYIEFMDTVLGELTGGERQGAEACRQSHSPKTE